MCKSKNNIIIIGISVLFLIGYLVWDHNGVLQKKMIESTSIKTEEEILGLIQKKEKKEEIPDVYFNDNLCAYDVESNTVYIPQNIENKKYDGRLKSDQYKLYFATDEMFDDRTAAIANGHEFKLYFVGKKDYYSCNVVFSGMPLLVLRTETEEYHEVDHNGRIVYNGEMSVFDPYRESDIVTVEKCSYHVRGGSSETYEKAGYKLEFGKKDSILGLRKNDDWILNALYDDAGLVHNKVGMDLWQKIARSNTVENDEGISCEYVELFLDDEYRGVYLVFEQPDKKNLSVNKEDKLYKCRADRIPEEHNYTNADTDGLRPIFQLKYPKEDIAENWMPLKEWVNFFLKEEETDPEQGEALLNMENSVDYTLFCLLIGGTDNLKKNIFYVADYQSDGTYKFIKIPWDLNATFGNPWVDYEEYNYTRYDAAFYQNVSAWVVDMSVLYYEEPEKISGMLYDRWCELRTNQVINEQIINDMFEEEYMYLYMSGAYQRNYRKWPEGKEHWDDSYVYEYINNRIPFLDNYFRDLYEGNVERAIYDGIDYTDEFEARYYWETNYETLSEIYTYNRQDLLEHYALYGKPFGLKGRKE